MVGGGGLGFCVFFIRAFFCQAKKVGHVYVGGFPLEYGFHLANIAQTNCYVFLNEKSQLKNFFVIRILIMTNEHSSLSKTLSKTFSSLEDFFFMI